VSAWRLDLPGNDRYYSYTNPTNFGTNLEYKLNLIQRYGGWLQLQYYWTEEIYTNVNAGFEKAFGFNGRKTDQYLNGWAGFNSPYYTYAGGGGGAGAPIANSIDPINSMWRASVTQWYRPVAAVKFALQYAYMKATYFNNTTVGSTTANQGNVHTLMANAWYMF